MTAAIADFHSYAKRQPVLDIVLTAIRTMLRWDGGNPVTANYNPI